MNFKRSNNYASSQFAEGSKITINDIVNYIETNRQFINNLSNEIDKLVVQEPEIAKTQQSVYCMEALQYNISCPVNKLSANLQAIFNSVEFIRTGSLTYVPVPEEIDISYMSSLITLLVPEFAQMKDEEKIEFIQVCVKKIYRDSRENFDRFKYAELGWNLKEFMNNVRNFNIGKDLLRYIADFLNVNVFILDCESDSLVYVGEKTFSKYKKNVLLLKIKDKHFEPIYTSDSKFIDHKSFIIKKLMNSRFLVERMDCDFTNDKEEFNFVIGEENLEKYFDSITDKKEKKDDKDKQNKDTKEKKDTKENKEKKDIKDTENKDKQNTENKPNAEPDIKDVQLSDDLNGFDQVTDTDSVENDVDGIYDNTNHQTHLSDDSDNADSADNNSQKKHISTKVDDSDNNSQKKLTTKVDKSKTVVQLKTIAKDLGIAITYIKDDKRVPKSKGMLIMDINTEYSK